MTKSIDMHHDSITEELRRAKRSEAAVAVPLLLAMCVSFGAGAGPIKSCHTSLAGTEPASPKKAKMLIRMGSVAAIHIGSAVEDLVQTPGVSLIRSEDFPHECFAPLAGR